MILYASELCAYREDDLSAAIRELALKPREEYEAAFPDLGTILRAVKRLAFSRGEEERQELERAEIARLRADREAHPEKYLAWHEFLKEFDESRKARTQ